MIDLSGRVALVTGSSRGIGRDCAIRFAEAGADVIVNYVSSRSAAMETAEQILALGRNVHVVKADISEEDDVRSMMDYVKREIGQLDIVVSNAATGGFRRYWRRTCATFKTRFKPMCWLCSISCKAPCRCWRRAKDAAR